MWVIYFFKYSHLNKIVILKKIALLYLSLILSISSLSFQVYQTLYITIEESMIETNVQCNIVREKTYLFYKFLLKDN